MRWPQLQRQPSALDFIQASAQYVIRTTNVNTDTSLPRHLTRQMDERCGRPLCAFGFRLRPCRLRRVPAVFAWPTIRRFRDWPSSLIGLEMKPVPTAPPLRHPISHVAHSWPPSRHSFSSLFLHLPAFANSCIPWPGPGPSTRPILLRELFCRLCHNTFGPQRQAICCTALDAKEKHHHPENMHNENWWSKTMENETQKENQGK